MQKANSYSIHLSQDSLYDARGMLGNILEHQQISAIPKSIRSHDKNDIPASALNHNTRSHMIFYPPIKVLSAEVLLECIRNHQTSNRFSKTTDGRCDLYPPYPNGSEQPNSGCIFSQPKFYCLILILILYTKHLFYCLNLYLFLNVFF